MELALVVLLIGVVGGGLSGLLGIGGGIVTAPLLLYAPALFGLPALSMHDVAGLTISQALFASVAARVGGGGARAVDRRLAGVMGASIFAASLAGGAVSKLVDARHLLALFLVLAFGAALLLLLPQPREHAGYSPGAFSASRAAALAFGVGFLGGLVGQGGSFVLIPLMVAALGVPLRVAMGTNLAVVFAASIAGFIGKAATGQVPPLPALALLAGVAPGTWLGARAAARLSTAALRRTLALLILGACLRMALDLLR